MATAAQAQRLSDAVVAFSTQGRFPEDITELPAVSDTSLQPSIEALAKAKRELEVRSSV